MDLDRHGLAILSRSECLEILGQHTFGRVAITSGALPSVLPVHYRIVDDQVMFRTGRGTKLDAGTRNEVVAFEIDDMDPVAHSGWSVVVTGVARVLGDEEKAALDVPLARWAPDPDGNVVAISTELISGRRLLGGRSPGVGSDDAADGA